MVKLQVSCAEPVSSDYTVFVNPEKDLDLQALEQEIGQRVKQFEINQKKILTQAEAGLIVELIAEDLQDMGLSIPPRTTLQETLSLNVITENILHILELEEIAKDYDEELGTNFLDVISESGNKKVLPSRQAYEITLSSFRDKTNLKGKERHMHITGQIGSNLAILFNKIDSKLLALVDELDV